MAKKAKKVAKKAAMKSYGNPKTIRAFDKKFPKITWRYEAKSSLVAEAKKFGHESLSQYMKTLAENRHRIPAKFLSAKAA